MISSAAPRRAPAFTPLALVSALALCFAAPSVRADTTLPTITITGARFASDPALAPIGATVISAADIRRAGANDVNQAIRKIGGVYGRSNLNGSPDFELDLRGFGTNSSQNLVVILDGVRLSENELSGAVLSSIPIETVERIEIIRGGASVLYGDGASGGVIQIVTKRPAANGQRATVRVEAGQFDQHDLRASVAHTWDGFALDAAFGNQGTDNYRDHNHFRQHTFSGGAQWAYAGGRAGLRVESARQTSEFAGSLTLAEFERNPRQAQASSLNNGSTLESDRATAFIEHRVGTLDLAAELSHREKTTSWTYYFGSSASRTQFDSKQTQFSPRLRQLSQIGGMLNEFVGGIDLIRWERVTTSGYSSADARQKSRAVYLRDELKWDAAHNARLAVGVRRERFDKDFADVLGFATTESTSQNQNAWELQGSVDVAPQLNLFAKAGRSYRVANSDENGYRASTSVLKVQTSRDMEIGATVGGAARALTLRAFRHALTNEIFYDPTLNVYGANTNLDPTERKGVELDAHAAIAPGWRVSAHIQHVKARFRAGPNAGRDMVLVPDNIVTARLAWTPSGGHSADLGAQWVDSQRYGSDFSNSCAGRIAGHMLLDARYARQIGPWEFAVAGLNLADKRYTTNAFLCKGGIYPGDGRQLKVSARYDF